MSCSKTEFGAWTHPTRVQFCFRAGHIRSIQFWEFSFDTTQICTSVAINTRPINSPRHSTIYLMNLWGLLTQTKSKNRFYRWYSAAFWAHLGCWLPLPALSTSYDSNTTTTTLKITRSIPLYLDYIFSNRSSATVRERVTSTLVSSSIFTRKSTTANRGFGNAFSGYQP